MNLGDLKFGTKNQLILLVIFAIGLNVNTLFHDYALDDIVVLTENHFVQKGIKGIPEILTSDYVKGYSSDVNILTGARYRPLSLVLFALEYQFFGAKPFVSHFINIFLFVLLICFLFKFLEKYLFREQQSYLAFFTCLLFIAHPIHTEVIANVKGRDEIVTFIFLIISALTFIEFSAKKNIRFILASVFCFLLALLAKETAITFIGVIPLIAYFFLDKSLKASIVYTIPFALTFIGYLTLRYFIVGFNYFPVNDITNAPYLYASISEAFATKVFILFKYIALLFFPHPLSSDYGYNQIPYITTSSLQFILSFLLIIFLAGYAVYTFQKKSLISFSILFFFITVSVGTNFIIDLGAPMADRMLFQPSLAFCILAALLFLNGFKKAKLPSIIFFSVALALYSVKTVSRNKDWKNNATLFCTDVISSPNCSRLNLFACQQLIIKANNETSLEARRSDLEKAIYYGEQSYKIHPRFAYSTWSLGFAYYHLGNYLKAAALAIQTAKMAPSDTAVINWTIKLSDILYKEGNGYAEQNEIDKAIINYKKAVELNKKNIEAWYNLGGAYFTKKDSSMAVQIWEKVNKLDPHHVLKKEDFLRPTNN